MLISDSFLPIARSSKDPLSVKLRIFFFFGSLGLYFCFFPFFTFPGDMIFPTDSALPCRKFRKWPVRKSASLVFCPLI